VKRIHLTDVARNDVDDLWFGIAADSVAVADRVVDEIHELLLKLLQFPLMAQRVTTCGPVSAVFRADTISCSTQRGLRAELSCYE
jgi:plasmid stabilization system protein ParE